jgi:hypothetical protein
MAGSGPPSLPAPRAFAIAWLSFTMIWTRTWITVSFSAPKARAAAGVNSMIRLSTNGPRSLSLRVMDLPLSRFVTSTSEGKGSVLCAPAMTFAS